MCLLLVGSIGSPLLGHLGGGVDVKFQFTQLDCSLVFTTSSGDVITAPTVPPTLKSKLCVREI